MNIRYLTIFGIFCTISLGFLLLQEGFWLYVDSGGWPMNYDRIVFYIQNAFLSFSNYTAFGYDDTIISSTRFVQTMTKALPMTIVYIIFFIGSFLSAFYALKIIYNNEPSFYGALFFTFNPVSLYFLKQVGYLFSYFSLPLIVIGMFYFITTKRIIYYVIFLIGILLLLSYTRLTGIYGAIIIIYSTLYYKNIYSFIKDNFYLCLSLFIATLLLLSPIILAFLYPYLNGDKSYFSGLGNYVDAFSNWGKSYYNIIQKEDFISSFTLKEPVYDFGEGFQGGVLFQGISTFLLLGIIFYSYARKLEKGTSKNISILLYFSGLILLVSIFLRMSAKFLSQDTFLLVIYKYFPFLANNTRWIFLVYIIIIAFLIAYNLSSTKSLTEKKYIKYSVYIYILISLFPLTLYVNNTKLALFDYTLSPQVYQDTLYKIGSSKNPTIMLPGEALNFEWSPYPIKLYNNNHFQSLTSGNVRLVNKKQQSLNKVTTDYNSNIGNLGILGLKKIIVFKDTKNSKSGEFNFYHKPQIEKSSSQISKKILTAENLNIELSTKEIDIHNITTNIDFHLYAPKEILFLDKVSDIYQKKIDLKNYPLIIDSQSYNRPEKIKNYYVSKENSNIEVEYKNSSRNTTKYYIKISNVDTSKDFLIHLNQTFGNSWKLKWINKADYIAIECSSRNYCEDSISLFNNLRDYRYLGNKQIKKTNHFEGNFIGNTWLIENDDIRQKDKGLTDLYAVIVYEKQFYYIITLFISLITLIFLIIASTIQLLFYKNTQHD